MEESRMPQAALQSIRKHERYHRPIARPILFWLNGDRFVRAGGECHPSDDFGSKLQVLEIIAGVSCNCCAK
jgi:hypothetical protein